MVAKGTQVVIRARGQLLEPGGAWVDAKGAWAVAEACG